METTMKPFINFHEFYVFIHDVVSRCINIIYDLSRWNL